MPLPGKNGMAAKVKVREPSLSFAVGKSAARALSHLLEKRGREYEAHPVFRPSQPLNQSTAGSSDVQLMAVIRPPPLQFGRLITHSPSLIV